VWGLRRGLGVQRPASRGSVQGSIVDSFLSRLVGVTAEGHLGAIVVCAIKVRAKSAALVVRVIVCVILCDLVLV